MTNEDEWDLYEQRLEDAYWSEEEPGPVKIEARLQRAFEPAKANKIAKDFDPNATGTLSVSERANGDWILLDGQHRLRGGALAGYFGPYEFRIFSNLTLEQEAKLFRQLNNTSKISILQSYRVALTEGLPGPVLLDKILKDYGLEANSGHGAYFGAVQTGLRILARPDGEELLRWALSTALAAWEKNNHAVHGTIIEALTKLRWRNRGVIDTKAMIDKLAGVAGGPQGLLGRARTRQQSFNGSMVENMIESIVTIYNKGRSKHRLPEWRVQEALDAERERTARKAAAKPVVKVQGHIFKEPARPRPPFGRS